MSTAAEPNARFALLLHGMVGNLDSAAMHARTEVASAKLLVLCSRSHVATVVEANDDGRVHVFVHSWNPHNAQFIDRLYGSHLQASQHEHTFHANTRQERGRSQALSIGRAALLMQRKEVQSGVRYELAMVMRLDLFVGEPVHLAPMHPDYIHLATACRWREPFGLAEYKRVKQSGLVCPGEQRPQLLGSPRINTMWGLEGVKLTEEVNRAYYTMDWWLAASPARVATWMDIATDWQKHVRALVKRNIRLPWGHWVWSVHIHEFLNLTSEVRFHDFANALGRDAYAALVTGPCAHAHVRRAQASCLLTTGALGWPSTMARCDALRVVAGHQQVSFRQEQAAVETRTTTKLQEWALRQCPLQRRMPLLGCQGQTGAVRSNDFSKRFRVSCSAEEEAALEAPRRWAREASGVADDAAWQTLVRSNDTASPDRRSTSLPWPISLLPLFTRSPSQKGVATHAKSKPGVCPLVYQTVRASNDCNRDGKGSWGVAEKSIEAQAQACADLCSTCRNCRFFSYSHQRKDCVWSAACHVDELLTRGGYFTQEIHTN